MKGPMQICIGPFRHSRQSQKNLTLKIQAQELLQFLHISAALDQQRGIFKTSADSWERTT
jgi:hypothetical protein